MLENSLIKGEKMCHESLKEFNVYFGFCEFGYCEFWILWNVNFLN